MRQQLLGKGVQRHFVEKKLVWLMGQFVFELSCVMCMRYYVAPCGLQYNWVQSISGSGIVGQQIFAPNIIISGGIQPVWTGLGEPVVVTCWLLPTRPGAMLLYLATFSKPCPCVQAMLQAKRMRASCSLSHIFGAWRIGGKIMWNPALIIMSRIYVVLIFIGNFGNRVMWFCSFLSCIDKTA